MPAVEQSAAKRQFDDGLDGTDVPDTSRPPGNEGLQQNTGGAVAPGRFTQKRQILKVPANSANIQCEGRIHPWFCPRSKGHFKFSA